MRTDHSTSTREHGHERDLTSVHEGLRRALRARGDGTHGLCGDGRGHERSGDRPRGGSSRELHGARQLHRLLRRPCVALSRARAGRPRLPALALAARDILSRPGGVVRLMGKMRLFGEPGWGSSVVEAQLDWYGLPYDFERVGDLFKS